MKNKILFIALLLFISFCLVVFFKSLNNSNVYIPDTVNKTVKEFKSKNLFSDDEISSEKILVDSDYCKVKRITVNSGGRLSYQYHYNRSEVWTVVSGIATITLDDKINWYSYGKTVKIPQGRKHRVENREQEPLIFIEVQHGSSFEEEDIVRIEDDYNRK